MVIRILNIVGACNTSAEGAMVADAVREALKNNDVVKLSFSGISDVPSSFVNASVVALFREFSREELSARLVITDVTSQIAGMIRRCLDNSQSNSRGF
ncbi:STAS-like domain-containing protein [Novosphingobium sp. BL-8A]|uniref:STAS-like domain-containing protein n=1 Tax=Novosphingobium sp. BL-8A TaxID=3127639 RepID=UPI00375782B7